MLDDLYDEILGDVEGMILYHDFVMRHKHGDSLIELACGSGDLISQLQDDFTSIIGIDISPEMIARAENKVCASNVTFEIGNMLTCQLQPADMVCCFGDSLNYLLSEADVISFIENSLTLSKNVILLDCHHPSRLFEFSEGYEEDGKARGVDYSWQLQSQQDYLIHQFMFYGDTLIKEEVIQRVYDPLWICEEYRKRGCQVSCYTDFAQEGILEQGEKVYFVIRRNI